MSQSESRSPLCWFLLATFVVMPIVNFSAPLWPGGAGRFMDDVPTRIDAAGYAFSIWFVIFTGMILFSWHVGRHEPQTPELRTAIGWLIVAGFASTAFVPISIYGTSLLGWINIAAHFFPLVLANRSLRRHVLLCGTVARGRWTFFAPSMYLGWISAAFLIISAMAAQELGLQVDDQFATVVTCCVIGAISTVSLLVLRSGDRVFSGTIAWALIAVGAKQTEYQPIQATAWIAAAVILLVIAITMRSQPPYYAGRAEALVDAVS